MRDALIEAVRADGEVPEGSPAKGLDGAVGAAEKFLRLPVEEWAKSDHLSAASRDAPEGSVARANLAAAMDLERKHWLSRIVDSYLAGDDLAALLVVFTPRPENGPRTPLLLYSIREPDGFWRVSFDVAADVERRGEIGRRAYAAVRPVAERRLRELEALVTRTVTEPLPFRGTWFAHFRQSNCYFSFDGFGEVFVFQDFRNGTSSYGVCDYHLSGDEIVVEQPSGPVRLTRVPDSGWRVQGRWYPHLVADDLRLFFAEYPDYPAGEARLAPVRRMELPASRPTPEGTDATRPREGGDGPKR